jgi:DNA-binding cell septation regulator SpoVG
MKIEVLEIRPLDGNRPLKAFVDIKVDGTIIREFRLIKENGKRPWIATPQISWKDTDGQIKYKTVITLPDEVKGAIDFAILRAYTEEMENHNGHLSR